MDDEQSVAADFRALGCSWERVAVQGELRRLSLDVFSTSSRLGDRAVETGARGRLEERRGGEF
jgi:hypothetical protein